MSREEQVIEEKLENLLNAIIIYRDVEKKALQRITELLAKNHGQYIGVIKDG
mgnify:CR=1 FL=1